MNREQAKALIKKYNQGLATKQEQAWLENWYMQKSDQLFIEDDDIDFRKIEAELRNRTFNYAGLKDQFYKPKQIKLWQRIAAVASQHKLKTRLAGVAAAVALIVLGVYFFNSQYQSRLDVGNPTLATNDIAPGKNGATLTLANGKTIQLNDTVKGKIAYEAGINIIKTANGQVMYQFPKGYERTDQLDQVRNTLRTAMGETYAVILPDGTKVWLNAASSLKFDPQLHSHLRVVELTGEAYFEVSKDAKRPFIVISEGQQLEVLGTHFNVNTYGDEHHGTVTSLLEGSVKVNGKEGSRVLKPGERGVNTIKGVLLLRGDAQNDVDWKEGRFIFDNEPLGQIMAKVSRWYNVEIVDERKAPKPVTFKGSFSRYENVSKVLSKLEFAGDVKFKIAGRKITITK